MEDLSEKLAPKKQIVGVDAVIEAEHSEIARRRAAKTGKSLKSQFVKKKFSAKPSFKTSDHLQSGQFDTIGLALSGGGIRSAAFCAGAMQGLALNKVFEKVDYLSTVSGGGYAGTHVSVNMSKTGGEFPLLGATDEKKDTPALAEFRNNANYLKFGYPVEMLHNLAIYLRGLAANVLLVVPLLLLFAGVTLLCNPTYSSLSRPDLLGFEILPQGIYQFGNFGLSVLFGIIVFIGYIGWSLATVQTSFAGLSSSSVKTGGWSILVLAVIFFVEMQPLIVKKMIGDQVSVAANSAVACGSVTSTSPAPKPTEGKCAIETADNAHGLRESSPSGEAAEKGPGNSSAVSSPGANVWGWLQTVAAPFLAIVAFASKYLGDFFKSTEGDQGWRVLLKKFSGQMIVYLAALGLPLLLWSSYLVLVYWGIDMTRGKECILSYCAEWELARDSLASYSERLRAIGELRQGPDYLVLNSWTTPTPHGFLNDLGWYFLVVGLSGYLLSFALSPNGNSPHRLYRDRLANAFSFCMLGGTARVVPDLLLSDLMGWKMGADNKIEKDPAAPKAPYHLLNAALNVQRSREVNKRGRNADVFVFSPLYVGSAATGYAETLAMERSYACPDLDLATAMAVSGAAASSNMGAQSLKPLAFTLAAFNVRLGYWMKNPKILEGKPLKSKNSYFLAEAFGALDENSQNVYLTDGGHIENLGVYELLRRRCHLIIVVDSEADSAMNFSSFINLQRYARIDFGVKIDLDWAKIRDTSLAVQAGRGNSEGGPHCAIGKIEYENGGEGVLLYIKASVTGDENDYVRDYNRRFTDFPHQTTGDQFFSEEQFEVYRALGFHAANGALSGKSPVQTDKGLERLRDKAAKGFGVEALRVALNLKALENSALSSPASAE